MNTTITYSVKTLHDLTSTELHDALKLRVDVFVVEQACAYEEIDGKDISAWHVLGKDGLGKVVAYARIIPAEEGELPHVGRVVIQNTHRGHGEAHRLMETVTEALRSIFGSTDAALAAQQHLERFYASHGFVRTLREAYPWDGIMHVDMERKENAQRT